MILAAARGPDPSGPPRRPGRGPGRPAAQPGLDLRYLTGYDAPQPRRLTGPAVPAAPGSSSRAAAGGGPLLVVPRLELPAAHASPAGGLGLDLIPWDATGDPCALAAAQPGVTAGRASLSDRMRALMALG